MGCQHWHNCTLEVPGKYKLIFEVLVMATWQNLKKTNLASPFLILPGAISPQPLTKILNIIELAARFYKYPQNLAKKVFDTLYYSWPQHLFSFSFTGCSQK